MHLNGDILFTSLKNRKQHQTREKNNIELKPLKDLQDNSVKNNQLHKERGKCDKFPWGTLNYSKVHHTKKEGGGDRI